MTMIICADDYGLGEDINEAVLNLAAARRLTAVSCMMNTPAMGRAAMASLAGLGGRVEAGLHLCLTDFTPLSGPEKVRSLVSGHGRLESFRVLLHRSVTGRVVPAQVSMEIAKQYARFQELAGRPPAFVDSHLHVHQFPGVRDGLMQFLDTRPAGCKNLWVRNAHISSARIVRQGVSPLKCLAISMFGRQMRRRLMENGIATNHGFGGIYDYRRYAHYEDYLKRFIACARHPDSLLMAHPGFADHWRRAEYDALLRLDMPAGRLNCFRSGRDGD